MSRAFIRAVIGSLAFASVAHAQNPLVTGGTIAATEDARISPTSRGDAFAMVRGVRPLADGKLAVITMNAQSFEVRLVDSTGKRLQTWPFASGATPLGLSIDGDTITVHAYDSSLLRFVENSAEPIDAIDYSLVRGEGASLLGSLSGPLALHVATESVGYGRYLAAVAQPDYEIRQLRSDTLATILRWRDSAARLIAPRRMGEDAGTLAVVAPWTHVPSFAAGGGKVFVAREPAYRIQVFNASDSTVITGPAPAQPLSDAQRDTLYVRWKANGFGQLWPDSITAKIRETSSPVLRPIVGRMFVSATGELAVTRLDTRSIPPAPTDSTILDIFDASHKWRGRVALPPRLQVHAFTGQHIYATSDDVGSDSGYEREKRKIPATTIRRFRLEAGPLTRPDF